MYFFNESTLIGKNQSYTRLKNKIEENEGALETKKKLFPTFLFKTKFIMKPKRKRYLTFCARKTFFLFFVIQQFQHSVRIFFSHTLTLFPPFPDLFFRRNNERI